MVSFTTVLASCTNTFPALLILCNSFLKINIFTTSNLISLSVPRGKHPIYSRLVRHILTNQRQKQNVLRENSLFLLTLLLPYLSTKRVLPAVLSVYLFEAHFPTITVNFVAVISKSGLC